MDLNHNGDVGDIIYALPILKHWHRTTGDKCNLYIAPANYTRQPLTPDKFKPLVSLLESQPYIQKVEEFKGQEATNGNMWRSIYQPMQNLCEAQLSFLKVPFQMALEPWITVEPKKVAACVVNRTFRYHNKFPKEKVGKDAVFIGTKNEHIAFVAQFGEIPYYPTKDLLEVAQVIAGSEYFIGNQSVCFAICEGLKKTSYLEVFIPSANTVFPRTNGFLSVGFH